MTDGDEQTDPKVRESVDAFRLAVTAVSDGFTTLLGWGRAWLDRRHPVVQFTAATIVWFGANWTYNRIAPEIIGVLQTLLRWVSFEFPVAPALNLLEERPVSVSVLVLPLLLVTVVVQNRVQTRKLKTIESKMTTMSDSMKKSADGGTRELPPIGPRATGGAVIGAIVGAFVGIWFGPGSVLAGAFLGFTTGDKWDIRAYEESPLTPDLNTESSTEQ